MKTRLFFDTETNGLPVRRREAPGTFTMPRVVQLAGQVYEDKNLFIEFDRIIKPDGWIIPDDVADIHGITTVIATEKGEDLMAVLQAFTDLLNVSDQVICHNVNFDCKVMAAELIKKNITNDLMKKQLTCTMEAGKKRCNLHNRIGGLKPPKLMELHKFLFNIGFEDAHNALSDVRATAKCYFEMKRRNWIE